jgi:hypothetical protein
MRILSRKVNIIGRLGHCIFQQSPRKVRSPKVLEFTPVMNNPVPEAPGLGLWISNCGTWFRVVDLKSDKVVVFY